MIGVLKFSVAWGEVMSETWAVGLVLDAGQKFAVGVIGTKIG